MTGRDIIYICSSHGSAQKLKTFIKGLSLSTRQFIVFHSVDIELTHPSVKLIAVESVKFTNVAGLLRLKYLLNSLLKTFNNPTIYLTDFAEDPISLICFAEARKYNFLVRLVPLLPTPFIQPHICKMPFILLVNWRVLFKAFFLKALKIPFSTYTYHNSLCARLYLCLPYTPKFVHSRFLVKPPISCKTPSHLMSYVYLEGADIWLSMSQRKKIFRLLSQISFRVKSPILIKARPRDTAYASIKISDFPGLSLHPLSSEPVENIDLSSSKVLHLASSSAFFSESCVLVSISKILLNNAHMFSPSRKTIADELAYFSLFADTRSFFPHNVDQCVKILLDPTS